MLSLSLVRGTMFAVKPDCEHLGHTAMSASVRTRSTRSGAKASTFAALFGNYIARTARLLWSFMYDATD